jgi:hypothetical protein
MFEDQKKAFIDSGVANFPSMFGAVKSQALLNDVMLSRDIDNIFLTEAEFEVSQNMKGTNPRPGRNLAEKLDTEFIFGNPVFSEIMAETLGGRFRIFDYKFVAGVPTSKLPDWLQAQIADQLVNNLGPYIKPEFRDMTYFHGIDYHQDIIDYPHKEADFITVYIYLDKVSGSSAPLHVLPNSHSLGCSVFPHNIKIEDEKLKYTDDFGNCVLCDDLVLTGEAGDMSFWHSATLHGTQPQLDDESRISLRILVERNQPAAKGSWLDACNAKITGNLKLTETRRDLDASGTAKLSGNTINNVK